MAEKRVLDLAKPLGELLEVNEDLRQTLIELGFEELPAERTIPELAKDAGVDLSVIAFALEASGYDVQGYEPEDDGYESPLPDMLSVLFDNSYRGESLPDAPLPGGEAAPMLANLEMAIRRAQQDGTLPKDPAGK